MHATLPSKHPKPRARWGAQVGLASAVALAARLATSGTLDTEPLAADPMVEAAALRTREDVALEVLGGGDRLLELATVTIEGYYIAPLDSPSAAVSRQQLPSVISG